MRSYSSTGATSLDYKVNVPDYWLAPAPVLPKDAGLHRFVWDLRYPDPEQLLYTYYGIHVNYFEYTLADHAIPHNTPWHEPQGPMVVPGQYEIRLTVERGDLPAADYGEARSAAERFDGGIARRNWIWRKKSPRA